MDIRNNSEDVNRSLKLLICNNMSSTVKEILFLRDM